MRRGEPTWGMHQDIQIRTMDITDSEHLKRKRKVVNCGLHGLSRWQKHKTIQMIERHATYSISAVQVTFKNVD